MFHDIPSMGSAEDVQAAIATWMQRGTLRGDITKRLVAWVIVSDAGASTAAEHGLAVACVRMRLLDKALDALPGDQKVECWQEVFDGLRDTILVGDMDLSGMKRLQHMPSGMTIVGNLRLDRCFHLKSMGPGLSVHGDMHMLNCSACMNLPEGLAVSGCLWMDGAFNAALPESFIIGEPLVWNGVSHCGHGDLSLRGCKAGWFLPAKGVVRGRVFTDVFRKGVAVDDLKRILRHIGLIEGAMLEATLRAGLLDAHEGVHIALRGIADRMQAMKAGREPDI